MMIRTLTILLADADAQARQAAREALSSANLASDVRCVPDGPALLRYLRQQAEYADPDDAPRPDLILLDLHVPGMPGRAVLAEIKADRALRDFPVVMLTGGASPAEVLDCYSLGAESFLSKPIGFDGVLNVLRALGDHWLGEVAQPFAR